MRLIAACRRPRANRMRQILLCALLVLPIAAGAAADAEQKKEELEALRARIQRVQRDLARDLGQRDELTAELRRTEEELARTATALREANLSLQFKQDRLQALEAEQRARKAGLAAERDALAGQVRAAYMAGREEKMKLLLNQQDPVSFGRVLTYYDYLNRARTARIERVNRQLARLRELEGEIAQELADLNRVRAERERILASLESTRDQRAGLLAQVDARIRDRNSELRQLQRDEQALSELVKSLMDVFADIPAQLSDRASFRDLRGKLEWPSNGQVVASFGAPRADGRMRWNGMMIANPPGTPVRAVSYGRIAFADWMPHYGLLVVIEHGDGYMSLYGHNQAVYKEVGDWVEAGEIIAATGDSGGQQRSALYFEIRKGRDVVDPRQWLRRRR